VGQLVAKVDDSTSLSDGREHFGRLAGKDGDRLADDGELALDRGAY